MAGRLMAGRLAAGRLVAAGRWSRPTGAQGVVSAASRGERRPQPQLQAVFTCGVPAAGKTHVLDRVFGWWSDRLVFDLDQEIKLHPRYNPRRPEEVYELREAYDWADARVAKRFEQALEERVPRRLLVFDGTGTKVATRIARMEQAKAADYTVSLLYVRVHVDTALARNAARTRRVPDDVLRHYYERIERTFDLEAPHADVVHIVDNDAPTSAEDHSVSLPHSPNDECPVPLRSIPRVVMDEVLPDPPSGARTERLLSRGDRALARARDCHGRVIIPDSLSQ